MTKKPTYEELEQRVKKLEKKAANHKRTVEALRESENRARDQLTELNQEIEERKRAEDAMRKSEERYRMVVENANEAIIVIQDGMFKYGNPKSIKLTGYTINELDSLPFLKIIHPDDRKMVFERYQKRLKGEEFPSIYSFRVIDKHGNIKWIEVNVVLITWEGKRATLVFLSDISERIKAKHALLESEEKYRTILESIEEAYFEIDIRGNFTFFNDSLSKSLGYSKHELMGMNNRDYMTPESSKKIYKLFNQIYKTGKPIKKIDYEIIKKDGAHKFHELSASLMLDQAGQPIGFRGIANDITERKLGEEALRESEEKYRTILESIEDGYYEVDIAGNLTFFNDSMCKILGYHKDELIGMNNREYMDKQHAKKVYKAFNKVYKTGNPSKGFDWEFTRKNGTKIYVETSLSLIKDAEAHPVGFRGIIRDISERKLAEEEKMHLEAQLQQAQKMEAMGTLAGGIAHDFNNLLMGIQGNTSLILLDIDSSHSHFEKLQAIEKMVQSGSKLTRQLLGYARKGRYEVKPFNLNQLVIEISDTFGRTRKEITIYRELEDDLLAIEADQTQIEQVLLNFYVNAADAMPGGGDLILKTMNIIDEDLKGKLYNPRPGKYVQLNVTDTGIGMDKKTIERIFDPFFTTKEMGRGTGLGLASAYGIIKAHGGYIDVYSKIGQGTTFTIYLPASEKKWAKAKEFSEEVLKGTETFLLVDDEEMIIDVGDQMLKTMGYKVLLARSGQEAIEVYKENKGKIDMVILDMIMPGVGGGEAYDRFKEINPNITVLLSSGYSIDGQAEEILERGCDGFIQKPFNMKELSHKLREILDNKINSS